MLLLLIILSSSKSAYTKHDALKMFCAGAGFGLKTPNSVPLGLITDFSPVDERHEKMGETVLNGLSLIDRRAVEPQEATSPASPRNRRNGFDCSRGSGSPG